MVNTMFSLLFCAFSQQMSFDSMLSEAPLVNCAFHHNDIQLDSDRV